MKLHEKIADIAEAATNTGEIIGSNDVAMRPPHPKWQKALAKGVCDNCEKPLTEPFVVIGVYNDMAPDDELALCLFCGREAAAHMIACLDKSKEVLKDLMETFERDMLKEPEVWVPREMEER